MGFCVVQRAVTSVYQREYSGCRSGCTECFERLVRLNAAQEILKAEIG